MVTVNFVDCISNYWFVWTIDGLGSVFQLAINMAISYFFLKYFHNIEGLKPSESKKSKSPTSKSRKKSPVTDMPAGSWTNDTMVADAYS